MLLDPNFVATLERLLPETESGTSSRRRPSLPPRGPGEQRPSRLERLLARLVRLESTNLHVLLDASLAMTFTGYTPPAPSEKFEFARRFTAALGYLSARRDRRFEVTALAPARGSRSPVVRGVEDTESLLTYLENLRAGGTRNFAWVLRKRLRRTSRQSLYLLLSDFRDRNWEWGAPALLTGDTRLVLVHLMDRAELQDENGLRLEDDIRQRLAELAQRYQLEYLIVPTDTPLEELFVRAIGGG